MRNITFNASLENPTKSNNPENQNRTNHDASILLGFGGGILSILLGFLLLFVFGATGETLAALKHFGLGLIFVPALIMSFGANFWDKSDREKR